MCGIIGSLISQDLQNIEFKSFYKYLNQLNHRGPDYKEHISLELENKKKLYLGFCRLAIQDLSIEANKIFKDCDNILLFNGEIYNYIYLKEKYFPKFKFTTSTDTEFLFLFLKKYGLNKIAELNGIFAIVWIDIKSKKHYLIRDRTGVKTLYYLHENRNFYFCSEAWFLYEKLKSQKIDFDALNFYLRYGFNINKKCIAKNVFKLQAGEILEYCYKENKLNLSSYLKNNKFLKNNNYSMLDYHLSETVKINLISDVKSGIFLSGGIDSSLLAVLSKKINDKIEAFTTQFDDNSFYKNNHDLLYAKKICEKYNIKLNINHIDFKKETSENFFNALNYFDEPLANLNILNSFLQANSAKQNGIKVILTGDGADEVFGGYQKYINTKISEKLYFLSFFSKKIRKYRDFDNNFFPLLFFEKLNSQDIKKIFKSEISHEILKSNSHFYTDIYENDKNIISNNFDFKCWLVNDHNYKLDRTLMANSIEGRVPYQSNEIIENYLFSDVNNKVSFFNTKIQLRENKFLPKNFSHRAKQGWHLPEKSFVRNVLKESYYDLVEQSNFINKNTAKDLFDSKKNSKLPVYKIITLYMFMYWNLKTNYI